MKSQYFFDFIDAFSPSYESLVTSYQSPIIPKKENMQ